MAQLLARKQLVIDASPEVVWKVHTDINAWSQWQRSISSARAAGPLAVGSSFEWKSGGLTITSTIQTLEMHQRISWTGRSLGTLANHVWMLEAHHGGTVVTTEESMTGWLVGLLKLFTPSFLDKSLDAWLHDLKNRAEAASRRRVESPKETFMESAARSQRDVSRARTFFAEAAVTIALAALAWLALDDITTDNSTGFTPEYRLLAACGAWCLFLAYALLKQGYRRLGATSVVAVASAVWVASDGLGHTRDGGWAAFWPEYTIMLVALLWFPALAVVLIALGRRAVPTGDTTVFEPGGVEKAGSRFSTRTGTRR